MIEAVILAAGESKRMGQLKPLMKIDGVTFLQKIEKELYDSGIQHIHVVLGHEAKKIMSESGIRANFVINENYQQGQFSSLQKGISVLSGECAAAVVCLADQPHIKAEWIVKLCEPLSAGFNGIVRPVYKGRSGHPIVYAAEMFDKILVLPATATAKDIMSQYQRDTTWVTIDSDGILYDADTPEDFELIQKYLS